MPEISPVWVKKVSMVPNGKLAGICVFLGLPVVLTLTKFADVACERAGRYGLCWRKRDAFSSCTCSSPCSPLLGLAKMVFVNLNVPMPLEFAGFRPITMRAGCG